MNVLALVFLVAGSLLLCPLSLTAATYHLHPGSLGSDAHDGSAQHPWKSLGHSLGQLKPGDTLVLASGVYGVCATTFGSGGQPGAPITLKAAQTGQAILDGKACKGRTDGLFIDAGKGHFVLEGLVIRNAPGNGLATDENSASTHREITVRHCQFRNNGLSGLELAAVEGFVVENVTAEDNGFYGLNIIGSKDGSLISSKGKVSKSSFNNHTGPEGHGLAINQGQDIEVSHCTSSHNRIHGFDVSDWPKGGHLSARIVFNHNRSSDNGKAGFAVNSDSSQVQFIRNLAWNNGASWAFKELAPGFWCYEGCRDCVWSNNTAVGNSLAGFQVEGRAGEYDGKSAATTLTFINNISWDNGVEKWDEMWALYVTKASWMLTLRNNNFGASKGGDKARAVGLEMVDDQGKTFTAGDLNAGRLPQGNISVPPQFRNAQGGDFRLRSESPLIDAGVFDASMRDPFCGQAPDIGAFEQCP